MLGLDPDAVGAAFSRASMRKSRTMPEDGPNSARNKFNNNYHLSEEEAATEKLCPFFWDPVVKGASIKEDVMQS